MDVLLALAIDVSRSVTDDEATLQRDGYRGAMTDPAVLAAIAGGPLGAIAVAYFEWARFEFQDLIMPVDPHRDRGRRPCLVRPAGRHPAAEPVLDQPVRRG